MAFQYTKRKQSIARILLRIFPVVYFVCLLFVGVVLHNDYGGFTDELMEIDTAAINIKYIFSKIPGLDRVESLQLPVSGDLPSRENLLVYEDRIYGTTALIPSLFVNLIPGVNLDLRGFLNFRRFYNFLTFWLALLCFYLTLRKRFENPLTAIFGLLVMTLTPRFFAESFYNSKDLIFFSWFLIALCCCAWYSVARSRHAIGLFFLAFALTANARYYGIGLLPAFLVLIAWIETKAGAHIAATIRLLALTLIGSLLTYYLATPLLWEMNWEVIREGLAMVNDTLGTGGLELYFGELIQTPGYYGYILVWIGLTVPILYLIFFLGQIVRMVVSLLYERSLAQLTNERVFDWMALGLIVVYYLLIVGTKTALYNGWRHTYFLYAPMLMLIVAGFDGLINWLRRLSWRVVVVGACGVYFALIAAWIVRNHPLDFVYFNEVGRTMASDFSRDYWGVGSRPCVMYLANTVERERISLGVNEDLTWGATEFTIWALPPALRDRFEIIWQTKHAQYTCFSYKNTRGNSHRIPGFRLMKTFWVDDYAVVGAYERVYEE